MTGYAWTNKVSRGSPRLHAVDGQDDVRMSGRQQVAFVRCHSAGVIVLETFTGRLRGHVAWDPREVPDDVMANPCPDCWSHGRLPKVEG